MHSALATAAEPMARDSGQGWKFSVGSGLIVAPAFTGAKTYSLLAVPDIRVAYKDLLFVNVRDGIGYAAINQDGWRIGPVVSYTFRRSEKEGGSIFRIAGGGKNALQGMGDVDGTVSVGGFVEYAFKPYKAQLHLHKGVTGHEGFAAEGRISYGGVLIYNGPPLIYSFGPHIKFGDQKLVNAYWGISPEQSERTGLAQYHGDAGITAYGVTAFALMPLSKTASLSLIAGYDRLAPPVTNSPLVRERGSENQGICGLFVSYGF
jgi:outer membrane scaffolding protein for murein synthesis (MipA/OmpV family)